MPTRKNPRYGTMQFWPRKRAKKETGLVRSWAESKEVLPLGFAGYKAGMMHLVVTDNSSKSKNKGQDLQIPVTVVECPPMKVIGIRYYKNTTYGLKVVGDTMTENFDKNVNLTKPKKKQDDKNIEFDELHLVVHTQPSLTGIGKKKSDIFELAVGGSKEEKQTYAKEILGKELKINDVFKEGQQVDIHAVTRGKGFQGVVKKHGVSIKQHKSEKGKRTASPSGSWNRENQTMWRNPRPGKMGYWLRTHYNQQIIKIGDAPEEIKPSAGIKHFGFLKNSYVFVKGSIPGPKKRIVRFNHAIRPSKKIPGQSPEIIYSHLEGM